MTASVNIRQKAIALLDRLPDNQLVRAVEFLETLSRQDTQTSQTVIKHSPEEALLQIIGRQLPPPDRERLDYLRQHNETGDITAAEHQELLMYVERIEQQDAERAAALIQLAELRNVELKVPIDEFLPTNQAV